MSKLAKYIVLGLCIIIVIFVVQNMEPVIIYLLFWQFSLPKAVLFCLVLIIGIALGWLLKNRRRILFK